MKNKFTSHLVKNKPGKKKYTWYTEEDMVELYEFYGELFGDSYTNLHEIVSNDIHLDVVIYKPSISRQYWTLVTMGAGSHPMKTTMYDSGGCNRVELVMTLPMDWHLYLPGCDDVASTERCYWPIRWLKDMGRVLISNDSYLDEGHTMEMADWKVKESQSGFSSLLVIGPVIDSKSEPTYFQFSDGRRLRLLQVTPLYKEELNHKVNTTSDNLLNMFDLNWHVVTIGRPNMCLQKEQ